MRHDKNFALPEFEVKSRNVLQDVLVGFSKSQKSIPAKYLYDKRGSEIFEEICKLQEYYPTRAEKEILTDHADEMASLIGPRTLIIEPGSGAGEKIRFFLPRLEKVKGYVPIEISREILYRMTDEIQHEFPDLRVMPVNADFTAELHLPLSVEAQKGKKVVFFPGSTIGNFLPSEALQFLRRMSRLVGHGGGILIGVDLKKDSEIFKHAYDDSLGITAAFNLNLLDRLNREANANFDISNFSHEAIYNQELGRVEMHLKSKIDQMVRVNETIFRFKEGETIHTENSYKYSTEEFIELCQRAKLNLKKYWKDKRNLFCVYYFERD